MKFQPKSEKEIVEENLIPAGVYDFEIFSAKDTLSKAQNEMIELDIKVFLPEGGYRFVKDYLLESIAYKLRHAADACGLLEQYNSGALLGSDFTFKTGKLKLDIQKDKTGQYADKNTVKDYVKRSGEAEQVSGQEAGSSSDHLNDDIPF
jgi:hypothetical protein